jgi:hypothetical protein
MSTSSKIRQLFTARNVIKAASVACIATPLYQYHKSKQRIVNFNNHVKQLEKENNCNIILLTDPYIADPVLIEPFYNSLVLLNRGRVVRDLQKMVHDKNKLMKPIHIILDSHGGPADIPMFLHDTMKEHNIKYQTYIPYIAMSAGTLIALTSDKIIADKCAMFSPVDTQIIDSNPNRYPHHLYLTVPREQLNNETQKYIAFNSFQEDLAFFDRAFKDRNIDVEKLKDDFLSGKYLHSHIFRINDLKKHNLNVEEGVPDEYTKLLDEFYDIVGKTNIVYIMASKLSMWLYQSPK